MKVFTSGAEAAIGFLCEIFAFFDFDFFDVFGLLFPKLPFAVRKRAFVLVEAILEQNPVFTEFGFFGLFDFRLEKILLLLGHY